MRKGYKETRRLRGMFLRGAAGRRGQVTMFIILAIVLIGVIFAFVVVPRVANLSSDVNPTSYLRNCIDPAISEVKNKLSAQGGYLVPTNFILYQDAKIQYLCYTSDDYVPCTVQQPLLVRHVAREMQSYIEPRAKQCLLDLKRQYERQGYEVSTGSGTINVTLAPGSIDVAFLAPFSVTKDSTQTFQKFAVSTDSKWYELLSTAVSIIQYESTFGDSETSLYIAYYPNLKVVKVRRDDGSTVYKLSDVTTEDTFTFASRSLIWPQGITSNE
jgi:hypothetical protein